MNELKGPILIGLVVLASFMWGYKKDFYTELFARLRTRSAASAPTPAPTVEAPTRENFPPSAPLAPQKRNEPERPAPPPAPKAGPQNPTRDLTNPYARFMGSPPPNPPESMANTLDSISPGQIDNKQVVRRNAYFEKLSQQLRELKGEEHQAATGGQGAEANEPPSDGNSFPPDSPPPPPDAAAAPDQGYPPSSGEPPADPYGGQPPAAPEGYDQEEVQ